MPTLSNEEELDNILSKLSSFFFNPTENPTMAQVFGKAKIELLDLFATQNTALLKEVADKVIGADEFPADQDEWHGEEEAKIIGADELRAVQRSKLAAMGEQ